MVVFDLGLLDGDGIDILKYIKKYCKNLLVVILIVCGSIDDKVMGLDLGVDDYFVKFFDFVELFVCFWVVSWWLI